MLKLIFIAIFSLVAHLQVTAQKISLVKKDSWHGFARQKFDFEGREAWIVQPEKPLEGKPWIWKAYFPDWHTDMDSILLQRGFHLAYLETNDMFGSPVAMQLWNRFHSWMSKNGFAEKVALEGIAAGFAWMPPAALAAAPHATARLLHQLGNGALHHFQHQLSLQRHLSHFVDM
jgi:sialidase-1